MSNNNVEIEIKLPLKNPDEVKKFLNKNAELVTEDVYQKDVYYTPVHRDFLAVQYPYEWLRLRETPRGKSITYKHFYPENAEKTDYADEFETEVDNLEALEKIFQSLDFKNPVTVEKSRTTWMFGDVEIVIDKVTDLGYYVELEATKHFKNPREGKEYLHSVLKKLNAEVGEEDLRGYPFRILENKGYKFGV
ncbi:class IV adenylate cyclase [Patescibacteria group bacterium]